MSNTTDQIYNTVEKAFVAAVTVSTACIILLNIGEFLSILGISFTTIVLVQVYRARGTGRNPEEGQKQEQTNSSFTSYKEAFSTEPEVEETPLPGTVNDFNNMVTTEKTAVETLLLTEKSDDEILSKAQILEKLKGLSRRTHWRGLCQQLIELGVELSGYNRLSNANSRAEFLAQYNITQSQMEAAKTQLLQMQTA